MDRTLPTDAETARAKILECEARLRMIQFDLAIAQQQPNPRLSDAGTMPNSRWFANAVRPFKSGRFLERTLKRGGRPGVIQSLLEEQESIEQHLSICRSILSPMHRLPPEVLSEIFLYCLPYGEYLQPIFKEPPLALTIVSSVWRRVAISTPMLWSSLSVTIPTQDCGYISLIKTLLARSQTCPLSLEIYTFSFQPRPEFFFDIIMPESHRWRNLKLCLPNQFLNEFFNNPMVPLSSLECLQISIMNRVSSRLTISAPQLHSVSMLSLYENPGSIEFPWNQLTHFQSRYCLSLGDALELLRGSPKLQRLDIRVISYQHPSPESREPVVLPCLHSAKLITEHGGSLLERLVLPSLQFLQIYTYSPQSGMDEWPKEAILQLTARSMCALEKLHLVGKLADEAEQLECVLSLPTLTELVVQNMGQDLVTEQVLELLQRNKQYGV